MSEFLVERIELSSEQIRDLAYAIWDAKSEKESLDYWMTENGIEKTIGGVKRLACVRREISVLKLFFEVLKHRIEPCDIKKRLSLLIEEKP